MRHFDYGLPRYGGALSTSDGLLGLANAALFDPVLPMHLRDERKRRCEPRSVVFAGAARGLSRAGSDIALHHALGIPLGKRGGGGLVHIRYWLLAASETAATLRPDERYVVYVTNFGQTHDMWPRSFAVDDLRMPFLKNALVVFTLSISSVALFELWYGVAKILEIDANRKRLEAFISGRVAVVRSRASICLRGRVTGNARGKRQRKWERTIHSLPPGRCA